MHSGETFIKKPRVSLRDASAGGVRLASIGDLTGFLPTIVRLILTLRVLHLRWVLWLVWENVAPRRLAGVVVRLLPLGLRDGHAQNFACTPMSVEKPASYRKTTYQTGYKHPSLRVHFFSKEGERGEASEMLLPSSSLQVLPVRPSISLKMYLRCRVWVRPEYLRHPAPTGPEGA